MKTKSKKLDYETLLNFTDIDQLHEYIANEEVDKFGHLDIDKLSKFLAESFKINLEEDFEHWRELRENYYRRNILVHNDGKISSIYLNKLGLSEEELNKELTTDKFYLGDCCGNIKKYMDFISESNRNKFNIEPFI